ncbi:hypothetical protein ACKKBF_B04840 [Auxenochlorella protothecoides x Auxenochlorella symbiontica]|uniref:N-acetyltransferase domain-containing protein n=1 Tax=Auxenochlorella protothecoides TaxID=3075 RepID=A0A1D2A6F4_AUXPR
MTLRLHASTVHRPQAVKSDSPQPARPLGCHARQAPCSFSLRSHGAVVPGPETGNARASTRHPLPVLAARSEDLWSIADMHASVFHTQKRLWWPLLKLEMVLGLHISCLPEAQEQFGRYCCLFMTEPSPRSRSHTLTPLLSRLLPAPVREDSAVSHEVLGVVVIDATGVNLPPRRPRPGAQRKVARKHMAYLSNLAVMKDRRRSGLGMLLVAAGEERARAWGCRSMALHVEAGNLQALALYTRAGYRRVGTQPRWQALLELRREPLVLLMKRLPPQDRP